MEAGSIRRKSPMRKTFWLASPFIIALALLLFFTVSSSWASDDGLSLAVPTDCPEGGCAPGQRMNFKLQFSVTPQKPDPNTQICIYAPADGQDYGDAPWASFDAGWISDKGLLTGETYTLGQVNSVCAENADTDDEWLAGAYSQLITGSTDELEFALHIHPDADIDGYITVKIFEPSQSNGTWGEIASFTKTIELAERGKIVYVANTPEDCAAFTPCYVNSDDDLEDGIGTGLRDAILTVNAGDEIRILKVYAIKDNTVLIDKDVQIRGYDNAMLSYIGTECKEPMLMVTQGGILSELTINDGNCFNPSRNLLEIDSGEPVFVEHNTLVFGDHAVYIHDNFGDVTVAFNHIVNNDDYAVWRATGKSTGAVNIYANNIINNKTGFQVDCNDSGTANHNYWGEGQSATANADNCVVTNGKRLGALIRLSSDRPGVEAQRLKVNSTMSYAFDGQVGARRSAGNNFDLIIVNHGQGSAANIPFYPIGTDQIQPCSNFYDIFLADDAAPTNLILALSYNLNSNCVSQVESSKYCGGSDSTQYPLLWYDPATSATDGWDRTGQSPQGPGAGGVSGQETSCHLDAKEIRVVIDNTGRPGISSDLNFTPFVIGLPMVDGITLSQFTAQFDGSKILLKWITSSEVNVRGFYVLRSDSKDGPYARISNQINAIGDTYIGGIYQYTDNTIAFARTYYYKIEVIDNNGKSIATHGPVSILTATATPTATMTQTRTNTPTVTLTPTRTLIPTRTLTPTPTWTPFYYQSPTPYYQYATPTPYFQPRTATPVGWPTQVRTFGPTPAGTDDDYTYPTDDYYDPDVAYPEPETEQPIDWESTQLAEGYPIPETPSPTEPTPTPDPNSNTDDLDGDSPATGTDDEVDLPIQNLRWIFIIVGAAGGLSLLGAASVILAKSRFS
jgi:hypothetical protein